VTQARAHNLPTFAATVPFDHIAGPLQQGVESGNSVAPTAVSATSPGAAQRAAAATPSQPGAPASTAKSKVLRGL